MSQCPICSNLILRHISHNQVYWYCACCHQKVPNFTSIKISQLLNEQEKEKVLNSCINCLTVSCSNYS